VVLPVAVKDGAAWTVEARRVREDLRKDVPRRTESTSRYRAVYRETGGQGRLTLTPIGASILGELPAGFQPQDLSFPLELEVDDSLTPVRLVNWPQVRDAVYGMLAGQDAKVVEGMRALFDKLGDEQAAAMFLPQMAFLGLGQGLALEPGQVLAYDDSLPNPLGGPPIRAVGRFRLDARDAARRETTVVWTQAMDSASMAASMKVSMKALMDRMTPGADPAKMEAAMREMAMSRESRCRFIVDEASGLARQTECASTIDIKAAGDSNRRTDTWTITQSLPEYR
jgi:hypothetical protein